MPRDMLSCEGFDAGAATWPRPRRRNGIEALYRKQTTPQCPHSTLDKQTPDEF
jgi:hypothetical protein